MPVSVAGHVLANMPRQKRKKADVMKPLIQGTHRVGLQVNVPSRLGRTAISLVFRFVVREPVPTGHPVNALILQAISQIDSSVSETFPVNPYWIAGWPRLSRFKEERRRVSLFSHSHSDRVQSCPEPSELARRGRCPMCSIERWRG